MTDHPPLVALERITKAYPGVLANDEISLDLKAGEIHTVLGENGAGKTTLMGILAGLHRPDAGRILVDGTPALLESPRGALALGIGYVQQHFSLIPTLTVAQNAVLTLRSGGTRIGVAEASEKMAEASKRYGVPVELDVAVEDLSVGDQQRAELLKALIRNPRILILDEPTSLLTPQEAGQLAEVLKKLAGEGIGIFLISHKLEEVLAVSHRVSVLRRGRHVATVPRAGATTEHLAELMIGSLPTQDTSSHTPGIAEGPIRLELIDVHVERDRGGEAVRGVGFRVLAGEVLGIAGLEGGGQVELTEAIAGVRRVLHGKVLIDGHDANEKSTTDGRATDIAHVPSDRLRTGLIPSLSVADNLVLPDAANPPYSRFGILSKSAIRDRASELIRHFDIRVPGPTVLAGHLSGGNQQKMILARELAGRPGIIVCCYPTRGLDIAASDAVQREILSRRDEGAAVVWASVDLDELLAITDRIIVLHQGKMTGEVLTKDATAEQLGLLMGGAEAA
jgi:general nucleoside transport system ATP-binding protein